MKQERKMIRAVILMVLLAFLSFNASKVTATEETAVEKADNVSAGVILEMNQLLEKVEVDYQLTDIMCTTNSAEPEATVVAPERDMVQSAEEYTPSEETENAKQEETYYSMSQQEFELSCKIAVAEAGNQGLMGMVYVINCAINNAKALEISLLEEYNCHRYSSIVNGEVCIVYYNEMGEQIQKPITEDMITEEVRQAVSMAASKDYTEEMLRDIAIAKGYDSSYYEGGAQYFYNPNAVSGEQLAKRANISVSFIYRDHVFYRLWE